MLLIIFSLCFLKFLGIFYYFIAKKKEDLKDFACRFNHREKGSDSNKNLGLKFNKLNCFLQDQIVL